VIYAVGSRAPPGQDLGEIVSITIDITAIIALDADCRGGFLERQDGRSSLSGYRGRLRAVVSTPNPVRSVRSMTRLPGSGTAATSPGRTATAYNGLNQTRGCWSPALALKAHAGGGCEFGSPDASCVPDQTCRIGPGCPAPRTTLKPQSVPPV
jgi:hypothetical protein